jgi:hypothetical protein
MSPLLSTTTGAAFLTTVSDTVSGRPGVVTARCISRASW